ncbi:MAG: hypothetical protein R2911_37375 [Caldilineaceae bacterium]
MKHITHPLYLLLTLFLLTTPLTAAPGQQPTPLDIPANLDKLYATNALIIQFATDARLRRRTRRPKQPSERR